MESKLYGSTNSNKATIPLTTSENEPKFYRTKHSLNYLNYLNLFGYVINFVFVSGTGTWFFKDLPVMENVSNDYQTLITPAPWAFAIWGIIFVSEGIFAICQLLPSYRAHPLLQNGVSIWFFIACLFQSFWVYLFLSQYIYASMVAMLCIEIPLIMIITSQQYEVSLYKDVQSKKDALIDFWLLRFPFEIHGGWITVATILNINIIFVAAKTSAATQLAITMVSFGIVLMALVFALFVPRRSPRFTIAFVFAWAMYGVQAAMQSPASSITLRFSSLIITSVQYCASIIYISILVIILLKILLIWGLKKNQNVDSGRGVERAPLDTLLLNEEVPLYNTTV